MNGRLHLLANFRYPDYGKKLYQPLQRIASRLNSALYLFLRVMPHLLAHYWAKSGVHETETRSKSGHPCCTLRRYCFEAVASTNEPFLYLPTIGIGQFVLISKSFFGLKTKNQPRSSFPLRDRRTVHLDQACAGSAYTTAKYIAVSVHKSCE